MKNLFLMAALVIASQFSFSQVSYEHTAGASIYAGGEVASWGINYSPRINLAELGDDMFLSLGSHIGLGLSLNSQEGASSFTLDLPLMAEANFGYGSNDRASSNFGGFAGLGFGISKIGSSGTFGADYNDAAGLVLNGGVRALIADSYPLGVRLSYMLNFKEGYDNVIGIQYVFE